MSVLCVSAGERVCENAYMRYQFCAGLTFSLFQLVAPGMAVSVGRSTTLVQTEITQ